MPDDHAAALRNLQEELIAAQRQELLGAVAAMMAHEFNNLMTPVLARAQDAVARDDVSAMRKALSVTVTQTQKAIDITRRLLELAGGSRTSPQRVSVRESLGDALATSVRPLEKDGIELDANVPHDLGVLAEPVLLTQALATLLNFSRARMGERAGRMVVRAERAVGMVRLDLSDNARAASRDWIQETLAPFLRADVREFPCDSAGVGHGLNACRTIVQFHGGRMDAAAPQGGGCTVSLWLPAAD